MLLRINQYVNRISLSSLCPQHTHINTSCKMGLQQWLTLVNCWQTRIFFDSVFHGGLLVIVVSLTGTEVNPFMDSSLGIDSFLGCFQDHHISIPSETCWLSWVLKWLIKSEMFPPISMFGFLLVMFSVGVCSYPCGCPCPCVWICVCMCVWRSANLEVIP